MLPITEEGSITPTFRSFKNENLNLDKNTSTVAITLRLFRSAPVLSTIERLNRFALACFSQLNCIGSRVFRYSAQLKNDSSTTFSRTCGALVSGARGAPKLTLIARLPSILRLIFW